MSQRSQIGNGRDALHDKQKKIGYKKRHDCNVIRLPHLSYDSHSDAALTQGKFDIIVRISKNHNATRQNKWLMNLRHISIATLNSLITIRQAHIGMSERSNDEIRYDSPYKRNLNNPQYTMSESPEPPINIPDKLTNAQIHALLNSGGLQSDNLSIPPNEFCECVQKWAQSHDYPAIRSHALKYLAHNMKDYPRASEILNTSAVTDKKIGVRFSAIRELSLACPDHDVLELVMRRLREETELLIREKLLKLLVQVWKDHPEVWQLLMTSTHDVTKPQIQILAIRELAKGWPEHPEVLETFITLARCDDNPEVRREAVLFLASWIKRPECFQIVTERAVLDQDRLIRSLLIRQLAWQWQKTPELISLLKNRARFDDDPHVCYTAIDAFYGTGKEHPEILEAILDRIQSDDHSYYRQKYLIQLCKDWKGNPEVPPVLKAIAHMKQSPFDGSIIVGHLVEGWKDDPETFSWLKNFIENACDWMWVDRVIQTFSAGWRDHPEMSEILKAWAAASLNARVRAGAAAGLGRIIHKDAEGASILKSLVRSDGDELVRQSALEALASGWKEDPETLALILDHAVSEESSEVRRYLSWAIIRVWADQPWTFPWLMERVKDEPDESAAAFWIRYLPYTWQQDLRVLEWLKTLAQSESRDKLREEARFTLLIQWSRDHPELRQFLSMLEIKERKRIR
jgi:HEAT repeat protein